MKKVRTKADVFVFNDDIYHFGWMVVADTEINEAIKIFCNKTEYKDVWELPSSNRTGHFAAIEGHRNGLIWFKHLIPNATTIAHECFHATVYALNELGIKQINNETEELFSYYLEWLVSEVNKALK